MADVRQLRLGNSDYADQQRALFVAKIKMLPQKGADSGAKCGPRQETAFGYIAVAADGMEVQPNGVRLPNRFGGDEYYVTRFTIFQSEFPPGLSNFDLIRVQY